MTEEQIKAYLNKIANSKMDSSNIQEFLSVAQMLSKNYMQMSKKYNRYEDKKDGNVTHRVLKTESIFNDVMTYLMIFHFKYAAMVSGKKSKCTIDFGLNDNIMVPAHTKSDGEVIYKLPKFRIDYYNDFVGLQKTVIHEQRHSQQFQAFQTENIKDILGYDPNSILIAKEYLLILNKGQKFYQRNHDNSIMERDADLYSKTIISELINKYFPEQRDSFLTMEKMQARKFVNPFEKLENGILDGYYISDEGQQLDRAIEIDKTFKATITPQVLQQFPILNLVYKDGKLKSYAEIIADKNKFLQETRDNQKQREQIEELYKVIINSDPMLYLEDMLSKKEISSDKIINLFIEHKDLYKLYQNEIIEIFERKGKDIEVLQNNTFNNIITSIVKIVNDDELKKAYVEVKQSKTTKGENNMDELINQRKELEDKLQLLRQKKQTLGDLESEVSVSIIKIETELKNLNDRIKIMEHQQKTQNLNVIRNTLGVTFADSYYSMGGQDVNSPPSITYKTLKELQEEYTRLDLKLREKLDDNEITTEQCIMASKALSALYNEYKRDAVNREQRMHQNKSATSTNNSNNEYDPNKITTEKSDPFESIRIEYRRSYGYDDMTDDEKAEFDEKFDKMIESEQKKNQFRKKLIDKGIDVDKIDNFDELFQQEMGMSEVPEQIESGHRIR